MNKLVENLRYFVLLFNYVLRLDRSKDKGVVYKCERTALSEITMLLVKSLQYRCNER